MHASFDDEVWLVSTTHHDQHLTCSTTTLPVTFYDCAINEIVICTEKWKNIKLSFSPVTRGTYPTVALYVLSVVVQLWWPARCRVQSGSSQEVRRRVYLTGYATPTWVQSSTTLESLGYRKPGHGSRRESNFYYFASRTPHDTKIYQERVEQGARKPKRTFNTIVSHTTHKMSSQTIKWTCGSSVPLSTCRVPLYDDDSHYQPEYLLRNLPSWVIAVQRGLFIT